MARLEDKVKQAVKEISDLVKKVKEGDEDDFAKLAQAFDEIANKADAVAERLGNADKALDGESESSQADENGADEAASAEEEAQKK